MLSWPIGDSSGGHVNVPVVASLARCLVSVVMTAKPFDCDSSALEISVDELESRGNSAI